MRNHLAPARLRALVGGDVFRYHCLTSVYLNGRWVKSTSVFPRILCKLYHIAPLEFDGTTDSLHHPFDLHDRRHMEFLHTHGEFADLPYDRVVPACPWSPSHGPDCVVAVNNKDIRNRERDRGDLQRSMAVSPPSLQVRSC